MMGFFDKYTDITAQIEVISNLEVIQHWDTLAVLCQMVNTRDNGPKEASRALRRRLTHGAVFQQLNSITITQVLIDGCGSKFKAQVATQKFADVLSNLAISPATNPALKSRLMERLGAWARSFSGDPGLLVIPQLYQYLCSQRLVLIPLNSTRVQQLHLPAPQYGHMQQRSHRPIMTPEQNQTMIRQDIELATNNAHMLSEAVSFADPDLEAVEENDLIKEFHSKCLTLQRGIQNYLTGLADSPTPDERLMDALLAANQELVLALSAHAQMMDTRNKVRLARTGYISTTATNAQPQPDLSPDTPIHDLLVFRETSRSASGSASSSRSASPKMAHQTIDPFADESYYISGPTDVASIVKKGKQPQNKNAAVADFILRQEQEEREYLRQLQEQPLVSLPQSSSSSSPATRA
ncbi:putative actin patch assembly and actin polymerization protein [Podila clonocystis]|nr:putative actin patch assembly and actin polymerization protein [Podila clonocystis]